MFAKQAVKQGGKKVNYRKFIHCFSTCAAEVVNLRLEKAGIKPEIIRQKRKAVGLPDKVNPLRHLKKLSKST